VRLTFLELGEPLPPLECIGPIVLLRGGVLRPTLAVVSVSSSKSRNLEHRSAQAAMLRQGVIKVLQRYLSLLVLRQEKRSHHANEADEDVDNHGNGRRHLGNQRAEDGRDTREDVADAEDTGADDRWEVLCIYDVAKSEGNVDAELGGHNQDHDLDAVVRIG